MHSRGTTTSRTVREKNRASTSRPNQESSMPSSKTRNSNRAKVRTGNGTLSNRSRPLKEYVTHNRHSNSGASSRVPGKIIALIAGIQTTAPGNSVVATTAIEFQTLATADTLGRTMDFAFTVVHSWSWMDARD